jgi:2-oxoglutarate ferredoxin oxidoreductase subunit delta
MAKNNVTIEPKFCKGCLICISACPKNVIGTSDVRSEAGSLVPQVLRVDDCIGCMLCEKMCPDTCITVERGVNK